MEEGSNIPDGPCAVHGIVEDIDESSIFFIVKRVSLSILPVGMQSHEQCWYQDLEHKACNNLVGIQLAVANFHDSVASHCRNNFDDFLNLLVIFGTILFTQRSYNLDEVRRLDGEKTNSEIGNSDHQVNDMVLVFLEWVWFIKVNSLVIYSLWSIFFIIVVSLEYSYLLRNWCSDFFFFLLFRSRWLSFICSWRFIA